MHANTMGLLFLALCFLLLFCFLYIKGKYGFWIQQPVFHIYNLDYYFFPPGIIDPSLPEKNKFTDFLNIQTFPTTHFSSFQWQSVLHMIRQHYLQTTNNYFSPWLDNLLPYFEGHNATSFCSVYYNKKEHLFDVKRQEVIGHESIVGFITSRPITVFFFHHPETNTKIMEAYYVDYLCVEKKFRKHGLAPQLIQTHHYNQRHANKKRVVTIFKREQELTGIVPICVYTTYGFPLESMKLKEEKISTFDSKLWTIVEVNKQNFYFAHDFISTSAKQEFDFFLQADCGNLLELIKTENIFLFLLLENQDIKALYCYRKTRVFVDKHKHVLSCFASINKTEESLFIDAFKTSFWKTCAKHHFGFAAIENISHNYLLIDYWKEKRNLSASIESPTAYFFYNYATPTCNPRRVLVIN